MMRRRLTGLAILAAILAVAYNYKLGPSSHGDRSRASADLAETYRLVQAIGDAEKVIAKGLTRPECEARKRELRKIAEALGTYNERLGFGSITCPPDSLFND